MHQEWSSDALPSCSAELTDRDVANEEVLLAEPGRGERRAGEDFQG